jgi:hypothetical protein
MEAPTMAKKL